jgi:nickel-dependent lactate racemase
MEVEFSYGDEKLQVELPSEAEIDYFAPLTSQNIVEYDRFYQMVSGSGQLEALLQGSVLFVVNDAHRTTPTSLLLDWFDRLDDSLLSRASFIIATGTHDPPRESHLRTIFGPLLERVRLQVVFHDCHNKLSLSLVGRDSFGGDVFVNSLLFDFDHVIVISSVEPHYFAGFTGGRKSLFPGLADFSTVERNHNLANSLEAKPLRLLGNPVAEHLDELISLVDTSHLFSVQAVLNSAGKLAGLCTGDLSSSFHRAVELARQLYSHSTRMPYDIVFCELSRPLDSDLYQAQKAVENCQMAVVDTGTLVVLSPCSEGIGSEHFYRQASSWDRKTNRPGDGVIRFGSHKLSRMNNLGKRMKICLYSELPSETVRTVFYEPADDLTALIKEKAKDSETMRVAVVRDAGHTVVELDS